MLYGVDPKHDSERRLLSSEIWQHAVSWVFHSVSEESVASSSGWNSKPHGKERPVTEGRRNTDWG